MTSPKSAYSSFGTQEERLSALSAMTENIDSYGVSSANMGSRTFQNIGPNTSALSEYNRSDYEYFRPSEMLPRTTMEKIAASIRAYDDFGIIHNIVDLMGDFASQGVRIAHPNKKIQKFLNNWFKKVNGKERSNAFLNMLYRCGNVFVRRLDGKISLKTTREMSQAQDGIPNLDVQKQEKRKIPLRYIFYTPLAIELIGGDLASFCDSKLYALKLSGVASTIKRTGIANKTDIEQLVGDLPLEIQQALKSGKKYIPLNRDEVSVYHYKKDDWDGWAKPMIAPILKDLYMLDKLKLADLTALDGAISSIRIWKLGHLDGVNSILPNKAALDKLRSLVSNNSSGGVQNLVWGPELNLTETASTSYNFLGEEKYKPVLEAIYTGLGIPQTLVGSGGKGFTNNYMSLKTLVERLEYGREILVTFWDSQLKLIQQAMGHKEPGVVIFDEMVLSDEAAQGTLLLQMVDRNLISDETLRDRIKVNNDIEETRIRREAKDKGTRLPPKASQFHSPHVEDDLKKILLQGGSVAPSELGVDLLPRKKGEKSKNDQQMEMQQKVAETRQKGSTLNGRPPASKDSTKRKQKKVLPKAKADFSFASLSLVANDKYKSISEIVSQAVLQGLNKKNLRMLTTAEFSGLEKLKFTVFSNFSPLLEVTAENVYSILEKGMNVNSSMATIYKGLCTEFIKNNDREPTTDERRSLEISSYIITYSESDET